MQYLNYTIKTVVFLFTLFLVLGIISNSEAALHGKSKIREAFPFRSHFSV